jgi:4,5-dihydroxyphthalate decarboxylase
MLGLGPVRSAIGKLRTPSERSARAGKLHNVAAANRRGIPGGLEVSKLQISFACCPYDRLNPIISGRVPIEGCDCNFFPLRPEELFPRVYNTQDFDVTELSASSHILTALRGDAHYVAIPAFVSRVFRHGDIYIRTDRGIRGPEDLRGKIVGVPEYQMTAALWIRGILSDEYGVKTSEIRWRNGGLQRPGRGERTPISLPDSIELKTIPPDKSLSGMLADGEIDALITAVQPRCYAEKAPSVDRLFRDYRAVEEAYFRKTGMFPIMHLMAIRKSLAEQYPWLAGNVFKACLQARNLAAEEIKSTGMFYAMLPWLSDDLKRAYDVMGPNMWPYGANANRKELEAMLRWSFEQGLAPRQGTVEEIFAPGMTEARWDTNHSP